MASRKILTNEKGMVLVVALLLVAVLTLLGSTAVMTTTTDIKISGNYRDGIKALYIAEAGLERARTYLRTATINTVLKGADGVGGTSDDGLLGFGSSVSFGGGTYEVRVTDNNDGDGNLYADADNQVTVTSTGRLTSGSVRVIRAIMAKSTPPSAGLRAAVVANGPIETKGNGTIDGRDHDLAGNLIAQAGTLGISTKRSHAGGKSSKAGGTDKKVPPGTDVTPSNDEATYSSIVEENATWTPPLTPDEVLGLPEGTLKAYAQSGEGGSQYVTDGDSVTFPMTGVTYVELASGDTWQPHDVGASTGILVVHNSDTNAIMKNTNQGSFTGVMIVDDYVHNHNDILGAVVNLTSAPSEGNCIGNGNGTILFSRIAIANALSSLASVRTVSWQDVY